MNAQKDWIAYDTNALTIGEIYGPAMKITDHLEAAAYFAAMVKASMQKFGHDRDIAESNARESLGYYAGYYDNETRKRVERLFMCAHPVFGSIEEKGAPGPDAAFRMGLDAAKGKQT